MSEYCLRNNKRHSETHLVLIYDNINKNEIIEALKEQLRGANRCRDNLGKYSVSKKT